MSAATSSVPAYVRKHWLWLLTFVGALIPLLWLIWDFATDNLSVNPIDDITERTGQTALKLIILTLACTPVNILTGFAPVLTLRKTLGLYGFFYACFHFLNFVGLDYGFQLGLILNDGLLEKPYIFVGLTAFILLIPLAITSTKGWMKRLGRNWKRLHSLVYLVGGLIVLHFYWLAKAADRWEPLLYALAVALLLLVRIPPVRKFLVGLRRNKAMPAARPAPRKPRPAS